MLYGLPDIPAGRLRFAMAGLVSGVTVTSEVEIRTKSILLLAVTVTFVAEVTVGAVNKPLGEMVPALASQTTAVSLVARNVAENCCWPPE